MNVQLVKLTLTGEHRVQVRSAIHRVPKGCRTHYVRNAEGGEICYLLLPTGEVHCLTERGEVTVPPELQETLRREKFKADA